jgi:hypothetical protein
MTTTYVALIGDAVASRTLAPARRTALQRALRATVLDVNHDRRWRAALAARFAVTLGDEFQGLLTEAEPVWDIVHTVRARVPDVAWVIACGRGPLSTRLDRSARPLPTAPELDGPCFHSARAALERAKRDRWLLAFGGLPPALDGFAAYYSALYWSWTPRQRRAATLLRIGTPTEAAARLKVDRSAISHLARRMGWPQVAAGDTIFRTLLEAAT